MDAERVESTRPVFEYACSLGVHLRCVVCDALLMGGAPVYVLPTTHRTGENGCFAVTYTFSCATHKVGTGSALCERILAEAQHGIVARELDHPREC